MADTWTHARLSDLCRMWDAGESALSIARQMKISRNAVIGKIHRLRQAGHPFSRASMTKAQIVQASSAARAVQEIHRQKRVAAALKRREGEQYRGTIARMVVKPEPQAFASPAVIVDASFAKPWQERAFGECAYPIGGEGAETISCCARTFGQTYCTGHYEVMFQPRKPYQKAADKRFLNHLNKRFAA